MNRLMITLLLALLFPATGAGSEAEQEKKEKLNGYLEWRQGEALIVEGQRVVPAPGIKFKGKEKARSIASIPLGYQIEAVGQRQRGGSILATKLEAKPNGLQQFEKQVWDATNQLEAAYREAGEFLMAAGDKRSSLGELRESGPQVDRARRIVNRLLPPHLEPEDVRVYVIDNKEWNAMAMGNHSMYVFSGLMEAVDDDELAIILGHELAHASHEHTRRQHKRNMWIGIASAGAAVAISELDGSEQDLAGLAAGLAATAFANGYSRNHEDQADRVGMRYAYEGGFDVSKGPALWDRFAEKYGDQPAALNIFFGDHSRSSVRARELQREIGYNYGSGRKQDANR